MVGLLKSSSGGSATYDQNNKVMVMDVGTITYDPNSQSKEEAIAERLNLLAEETPLNIPEDVNILFKCEFSEGSGPT